MEFDEIADFDSMKAWAIPNAATPEALDKFHRCCRHLVSKIDEPIDLSELEAPLQLDTGRCYLKMKKGDELVCYLLIFTLLDTGEHFDYVFVMDTTTGKYTDVRYLDPDIPASEFLSQ